MSGFFKRLRAQFNPLESGYKLYELSCHSSYYKTLTNVKALVESGCGLNYQDKNGETALGNFMSDMRDNRDIIKYLATQGADVNLCNPQKQSLLKRACSWEEEDIVCALLDAGATYDEKTATDIAYRSIRENWVDVFDRLFDKGLKVDVTYNDRSLLIHALDDRADQKIIDKILERTEDTSFIFDFFKWNALHYAVIAKNIPAFHALLEKNADCMLKDTQGNTPISWLYGVSPETEAHREMKNIFEKDYAKKYDQNLLNIARAAVIVQKPFNALKKISIKRPQQP